MGSWIKKNIIRCTKGDSLWTKLSLKSADDTEYIPDPNDRIRFALKKNLDDENVLIMKEIPTDTLELRLNAADTEQLDVGEYYYDVEIQLTNGYIDTIIEATAGKPNFRVTVEVD